MHTKSYILCRAKKHTFTRCLLFLGALSLISSVSNSAFADVYFSAKTIGPSTSIYSKSTEQNAPVNLITKDTRWRDLAFDVGKTQIVFMSNRHTDAGIDLRKQSEQFNIYSIPITGGTPKVIASAVQDEIYPKLSASEKYIAYTLKTDTQQKLILQNLAHQTQITDVTNDTIVSYAWHPTEVKLALVSATHDSSRLSIFEIKTKKLTQIHELNGNHNQTLAYVSWSPNGQSLAYITNPSTPEKKRQLHVLDLASRKTTLLSKPHQEVQSPISWSPDSSLVAYSALLNYNYYYDEIQHKKVYEGQMQVFLSDKTGEQTQLTHGNYLHNKPEFSPDGKHIAFLFADNLGEHIAALRIMDINGAPLTELYKPVRGGSEIIWK